MRDSSNAARGFNEQNEGQPQLVRFHAVKLRSVLALAARGTRDRVDSAAAKQFLELNPSQGALPNLQSHLALDPNQVPMRYCGFHHQDKLQGRKRHANA
jgi:hypothetical protein